LEKYHVEAIKAHEGAEHQMALPPLPSGGEEQQPKIAMGSARSSGG
jgi:hypothetical protein